MNTRNTYQTRNKILDQVKQIVFHHLSDQTAKIYLFGSWARFEEKRSSDIDIAIEFKKHEKSNHQTLAKIRQALEESTIPYRIDVVNLHKADDYIIEKVKKEGILWGAQANESK